MRVPEHYLKYCEPANAVKHRCVARKIEWRFAT